MKTIFLTRSGVNHITTFTFVILILVSLCTLNAFAQRNSLVGEGGEWRTVSSEGFTARYYATSSVLNGKIYVIGGVDANNKVVDLLEVYDPTANSWTTPVTTGNMVPRYLHSASVINGKIYLIGGMNVYDPIKIIDIFDPSTNSWTSIQPEDFLGRLSHTASVVNDKIYIIGGEGGNAFSYEVEIFDPSTQTWDIPATSGTFTHRKFLTSSVVNGIIYVIGGYDWSNSMSTIEAFDPTTNTWATPTAEGLAKSRGLSSVVMDNKIFVIGGAYGGTPVYDLNIFDPVKNTITTASTTGTFTGRIGLVSSVVDNKIYVMGGEGLAGIGNTNEVFYPIPQNNVSSDTNQIDVQLSPNPTSGYLTISGVTEKILHISLTNILGESVVEFYSPNHQNISLDLSSIGSGMYYVRIETPDGVEVRKLIKQ